MDDYSLERSRLLAGTTGLHAFSMEAALQPQLRPTFSEIGRSSIGTAVVDPTYQSRYFQGPMSLGGGTSLPFLGSMFTSSLLPSSQYRAPVGGGIVNMRQFWPPTPPPDAYSRCTMNGSLYPLYSSMSSLTPSSESASPYTSQSIMSHLTPSTPFTHLLETHKESPFLSPSLSLSSPLPPTHHLSYSAPYLPVPPSPILDRHPVYGSATTLGIKRLDDPTPVPELLESHNRLPKKELHSEKTFSKGEESRKRTRDGVKVAAVKGREKANEIRPAPVRDDAKRIGDNSLSSSIPAVNTATVSPSIVHGSHRTKVSKSAPLNDGVSAVKETSKLHLNEDCVKPQCNTMQVHPVVTTVSATSTGTTTSVTYSNSPIDSTFKPLVSCTPITVPTSCQNSCASTDGISHSTSPTPEVQPTKLAGKEEGQSIATFSTWVHHQTSITTVTNTRKTCYTSTSEKSECRTLTKQFVPETEDGDQVAAEAVNLSVEKIQPLVKPSRKDLSSPNKRERRSHEKKSKASSEKGVAGQNTVVSLAAASKEEPSKGDQDFPLNPQAVFTGAVISKKAENTMYSDSWSNRALRLKDEYSKRSECEFSKGSKCRAVDGKQNFQNQAMNLSVCSKMVKTEKPETNSSGEVTSSGHVYLDGFSEPGAESVSSSHSLSALSRLASSASSQMFSPAEVPTSWGSKNTKPSSMVSSVQSETMRLSQSSKSPAPPPSNSSLVACAGSSPEFPSDKAKTSVDCGKSIELKRKSLCSTGNTVLAVHETSSTVLSLTSSVGCASAHNSIPVGIAVAQQRQEPINSKRGNASEIEHFPVTCQPQTCSDPSKNVASTIQAELKVTVSQPSATSILVNQGTSLSATQWDSDTIIRAPLQNSWLAQAPVVTPTVWLGQGTYATSAPAPTQTVSGIPLDTSSHLPLPPVGYQLARDPLSGHIFLIPATNLELPVVERSSLWSTFTPGTVQQLVTSTPHHFQPSFQHTADREIDNGTHKQLQRSGSIKQEPCAMVTHVKEKLENLVRNSAEAIEAKHEVKDVKPITTTVPPSVTSIAVQSGQPFTFSGFTTTGTPTLSYYYEPPTIVHLTQPTTAAMQTEPGKRSQGTSPLNPVSPSPPPESSLDQEDTDSGKGDIAPAITTTMAIQVDLDACNTSDENDFEERTVEVLDSANQTDAVLSDSTKEESEDESPPLLKEEEEELAVPETEPKSNSFDNILEIPEDSAPVLPTESKPVMDFIDHHGLDLLVDSIEEFASREQVKEEGEDDALKEDISKSQNKLDLRSDNCDIKEPFDLPVSDVRTEYKPAITVNTETDSYARNLGASCTDGLGLLCALAEQRFLEESQKSDGKNSVEKLNPDINQNYQPSKKEMARLAPKILPLPKLPIVPPLSTAIPIAPICMDPAELEMRERLADLQRKYKQKQKELARLKPKKEKEDTTTCNPKKSPGRPRKHHFSLFSSTFGKNFAMLQMSKMSDAQEKDSFDEIPKKKKKLHSDSVTCNKPKRPKKKPSHSLKCHVLTTKQKIEKAVLSAKGENGFGASKFLQQQHFLESKEKYFETHKMDAIENTQANSDLLHMEQKILFDTSSDSDDDKLLIDLWRKSSIEKDNFFTKNKSEELPDVIASENHATTNTIVIHHDDNNCKPHPVCVGALGILAECASLYTDTAKSCKRKAPEDSEHSDVKSPVLKKMKENEKDETIEPKDDVSNEENDSNTKSKKSKPPEKAKKRPSIDEDPWNRRRSERIFLHDAGVTLPPTLTFTSVEDAPTLQPKIDSDSNKVEVKVNKSSLKSDDYIKSKKKVKSKKDSSSKKVKSKETKKRKEKVVPDELSMALKHCRLSESSTGAASPVQDDSSSSSEGDVPLIQLVERDRSPELRSCKLKSSDLHDNLRVLTKEDGLYYAGYITAIQAPDIYGITLDGERCNRPRIFSREELLSEAILEVKPTSVPQIPIGKRVCAFWSQQYRCLYPGKVAKWKQTATGPTLDKNMVFVEFDDGDSGRIPIEDIRLLPKDIPIQSMEPEPLLLLGKKRQRSASESQIEQKPLSASPEVVPKIKHKKSKKLSKLSSKSDSKSSNKSSSKSRAKKLLKSISKESSSSKSFDALSVFTDSASCTSFNSVCSSEKSNQKKKSKKSKNESKTKSKQREGSCTTDDSSNSGASSKSKKHKKHKSEHKHRHHHHRHHCHHSHHHKKHKHNKRQSSDSSKQKKISSSKKVSIKEISSVPTTKPTSVSTTETKKSELTVKIKPQLPVLENKSKEPDLLLKMNGNTETPPAEIPIKTVSSSQVLTNSEKKEDKSVKKPMKRKERTVSAEKSKIAAFLPARQLWGWSGKSFRRPGTKGKAKKEFFKAITRGKETIKVGDCAVFLSTGRPHLPYVGRIETMWQSWGGNMVVKVKWFYHPEETKGGKRLTDSKGALYQSPHVDENDVQTISHKCEVMNYEEYKKWRAETRDNAKYGSLYDNDGVYYLAGTYEPLSGVVTLEAGVS